MFITKKKQLRIKRAVAIFMLFTVINQIVTPGIAYALTAGPTAPEATNFEPIDTTDMVNPLSGSFTYGMPLLEVPGPEGNYPLALSYHAGIQPNEEASWVGLGWSLNPGAIARNVNGYPDDYSAAAGAGGVTQNYWDGGTTTEFSVGFSVGIATTPASVNFGLTFAQDTYRGFGLGFSLGVGYTIQNDCLIPDPSTGLRNSPFSIGASIGVSPYGGTYVGANVGFISGGTTFGGLNSITSIGVATNFKSTSVTFSEGVTAGGSPLTGASIGSGNMKPSFSIGGGSTTSANDVNKGKISTTTSSSSFFIPTPVVSISLGFTYIRYWSATTANFLANGALYDRSSLTGDFNGTDDDNYSVLDPINSNTNDDPLTVPGGSFPDFDDYSVTAQGLGGNMRPYTFSSILYNQNRINTVDHSNDVYNESFPSNATPNPIGKPMQFRFINDLSNSYRQGHPWNSDQGFGFDSSPLYGNNDGTYGYDPSSNRLEGTNHIEYFTNSQISSGAAALRGFITVPEGAGFKRANCVPSQIGGFMITNSSGVTYHYALPVYSFNDNQYSSLINPLHGPTFNDLNKYTPYAYTWYLTAITGPDYVARGTAAELAAGILDPSDWGYWVKFDYGKWADNYSWRTPFQGYIADLDNSFHSYSSGTKEIYYLDAIETRTHTAIFEKELRADGKSLITSDFYGNPIVQLQQSKICANGGLYCNPTYSYPTPSMRLKDVLLFQNDQLPVPISTLRSYSTTLNGAYTFQALGTNQDGTRNTSSVQVFHGENVIDSNDIGSSGIQAFCLRKIAFNYDYSLCPGVTNSFDPNGQIYSATPNTSVFPNTGKLTLLSVDFQGKGGTMMTPPVQLQYDLDQTNLINQGNISVTQAAVNVPGVNQPGMIQLQNTSNFNVGDILSFPFNGSTYYCTLLSSTDNVNFNVLFLNNSPGVTTGSLLAIKTKNPPYNYDGFDNWQCYKSDYTAYTANVNLSRMTTPVSNMSTDAWSLRRIVSSVGANININYEGNTFNRSVLNKNPSVVIVSNQLNSDGTMDMIASTPASYNLSQLFVNLLPVKGPMVFHRKGFNTITNRPVEGFDVYNLDSYPNTRIVSVSGTDIKVQLDPNFVTLLKNGSIGGSAVTSVTAIDIISGNLVPNTFGGINYGAGIRVKNVTVDDLNGNVQQTGYDYGALGIPSGQLSTSGVTSYMPGILDQDNLANALTASTYQASAAIQATLISNFKGALYKYATNLLTLSRVVPSPGVLYESVAVSDYTILPNGISVPVDGKTVYQYEVFKPEMAGLSEYYYEPPTSKPGNSNGDGTYWHYSNSIVGYKYEIVKNSARDISIKDYTSRVGNLKRMITYDNLGNKLTEKINHYLYDDLENTSLQNQIYYYEPRLSSFNGVAYNNMGEVLERYGTSRIAIDPGHVAADPTHGQYDEMLIMSNMETFPAYQTGTTQIDYKNGTQMSQTNLAYDFYTGAVTKTLTTDSYGNRFINQVTPAYMAANGTAYPALGLRTHDDDAGATQHKQMLSQQASNYTFSVDINNNPIGVITASAQTWSNSIPVSDQDGNATTTGQSNIWRMEKSYSWLATGTNGNNLVPYLSFTDYYAPGGSTIPSWKKTGQITQYNVYSSALEATDINNNYAATRMGYRNSKVLITGSIARYNEIAYSGAEDALLTNGSFSNNILKGAGAIVTDSTNSHTGVNTLLVPANSNGFTYTVPITSLNPLPQNYSVAVWVKPGATNINQAQLYYQVGAGAAVISAQTYAKSAAGWYLLEMTVPASAITSGNLTVGCKNASASNLYFDDFRFQPSSASATAYVYDNKTGELTYVLGNNNLYTRYQYDAIGRLVRVYKEVIGKQFSPLIEGIAYNYGSMQVNCPIVQPPAQSSTGSISSGTFISSDVMDNEWKQEAPAGYTIAADNGTTINAAGNAGANAGRFAYFSTGGTLTPLTYINGNLTFTAKGSGTIEIQLIATWNNTIAARKTFTLSSTNQNFSWALTNLYPQLELVAAVIVNGGNSSSQASVQFTKNFSINLAQCGFNTGPFTRFRADSTSLIGNSERNWYGWNDQYNAPRKKYLEHSAFARMRFTTNSKQMAIEYVRDAYDKQIVNLFSLSQTQSGDAWDSNGNVVAGVNAINKFTQVTGGQTYTISGLLTTNPSFVWFNGNTPLAPSQALTNIGTVQAPVYQIVAPANATNLGLLVQSSVDTYFCYTNCMIQQGAVGTVTPSNGTIPSPYVAFGGYVPSHISGPAVFIDGKLYKYYQVEGNDVAKVIQFVTDTLPSGSKTVEVMMPGQGTYNSADPHVRRSGTFLRAVYFSGTTTVSPSSTVIPGSIAYIHDSILSGFDISSDAQNNVWMMMTQRNPSYGFTADIFSEGYASRILYTDVNTPALTTAFATKLASFGVDKYWFQIGVNDYGFLTPLSSFYTQYKSLIEQLKSLRPNVKIYIQSTGPEIYEGPNGETFADGGLAATGPAANDFRDVQRAIATTHSYCEYVNFEGLFSPVFANLPDGIHPSDAGNILYANGIKNNSSLLGTVQAITPLAFYRSTTRSMIQSLPGIYTITAAGGKPTYNFILSSGTLPSGLTFHNDGTITGTPAVNGTFSFSVNVTDANAGSVTKTFSLTVNPPPSIVVTESASYALINTATSITFNGTLGYGPYTLSLTSGTLPTGMSFNASTGLLSGTPTTLGTYTFTVSAKDHWGFIGNSTFSFAVLSSPPPPPSDNYTLTASVTATNHLMLTGHLNNSYTSTLYAYVAAYYTPAGGSESFLSGSNINVASGSKDGLAVDMGAMALLPGSFSVRLVNGGISPTKIGNVTINYTPTTTLNLTSTYTSPSESFTVTGAYNASGHLMVSAQLPTAPLTAINSSIGAYVTQNGNTVYVGGPTVTIPAGSNVSPQFDFGLLNVVTGPFTVQLYIGLVSPTSDSGQFIKYSTYTNFSFTK